MPLSNSSTSAAHHTADSPYAHFDISTLPQEILLLIFSHIFHDNDGRVSCLSPLSLTCRRWRKAIMTENSFWSCLCIEVPTYRASQMASLYASKLERPVTPEVAQSGLSSLSKPRGLRELQMRIIPPSHSDTPGGREMYVASIGTVHRYLCPLVQHTLRTAVIKVEGASQLLVDTLKFFLDQFRQIMSKEAFSVLSLEVFLPELYGFPMQDGFWHSYSGLRALVISALPPYSSQDPSPPIKPAPPKPVIPKISSIPTSLADEKAPLLSRGLESRAATILSQHFLGTLAMSSPSTSSSSSRANGTSFPPPPIARLVAQVQYDATEVAEYEDRLSSYQNAKHRYDSWRRQQQLDWTGLQGMSKASLIGDARGLSPGMGGQLDRLVLEGVWLKEDLAFPVKGFPNLTALSLTHVKAGRSLYRLLESAPNLQGLSLRFMIPDDDDTDISIPSYAQLDRVLQLDSPLDAHTQDKTKPQDPPVPRRIYKDGNVWIISYKDMPQHTRIMLEMLGDRPANAGSNRWKWDSDTEPELDEDLDDDGSLISEDDHINYPLDLFMPLDVSTALRRDKIYRVETSALTTSPGLF